VDFGDILEVSAFEAWNSLEGGSAHRRMSHQARPPTRYRASWIAVQQTAFARPKLAKVLSTACIYQSPILA
jgi:hypothetical protein